MLTPDDKTILREIRDTTDDEDEKRVMRKTLNYVQTLENKLITVRTLLRTALNETSPKRGGDDE
jgi:hypothetical protein